MVRAEPAPAPSRVLVSPVVTPSPAPVPTVTLVTSMLLTYRRIVIFLHHHRQEREVEPSTGGGQLTFRKIKNQHHPSPKKMYSRSNYNRSYNYGSQLWNVTRELEMLTTDGVIVANADEPPMPLSERLQHTPVLRRVKVAARQDIPWAHIVAPPTTPPLVVDDIALAKGDALLLTAQTESRNGVVVLGEDAEPWLEDHSLVAVLDGTEFARSLFLCTSDRTPEGLGDRVFRSVLRVGARTRRDDARSAAVWRWSPPTTSPHSPRKPPRPARARSHWWVPPTVRPI